MAKAPKIKASKKVIAALPAEEEVLIVTKEGLVSLQAELEDLKGRGRKEVADRLREAISYGDLSENSEYEEAKNQQAFVEGRIMQLEGMIKTAKVVDESQHSKQQVEVGTKVKVKAVGSKEVLELAIVGSTESDPFNHRISNEAPVGSALMGAKVGDTVKVEAPHGVFEYEVVSMA